MCMVYLDFSRSIFLSHTHLVPWSPTHIVPSRSRGDLSITNTPSPSLPMRPCSPCVPLGLCSLLARPLLDMCYRGVSLCCKQSRTSYLRVSPHLAFLSRRCMCDMFALETKKHTHSLSNISFVVPFSLTHILFLHTHSFSFTRTWSLST